MEGKESEDYNLKAEMVKIVVELVDLMKFIDDTAEDSDFEVKNTKYTTSVEILHGLLPESLNEDLFVFMSEYVQFHKHLNELKKAKKQRDLTGEFKNININQ